MYTLIIGLDAFDPAIFEHLHAQGRLPSLSRYVESGGYARFRVANPPQSEVSWTSIATGAGPGHHGIFDFVHRDPLSYNLSVSLLPTKSDLIGTQFTPPYSARTIFEQATREGYPATALWWPATFPARPELPVRTLPGLGTPDIQGRLGVGTLFSLDAGLAQEGFKTSIRPLNVRGKRRYSGDLPGPSKKSGSGAVEVTTPFSVDVIDEQTGRVRVEKSDLHLKVGQWSPIVEVSFKMGLLMTVRALTQVILTQTFPEPQLYFLPLQIHPLQSPWRYAAPASFGRQTWKDAGPFLTLGWPQDTTALEEGWINDEQFIALCDSIVARREKILVHHLKNFREGVLGNVFDSLDRMQHMFLRDRPDLIEDWYVKLDSLVGRIEAALPASGQGKPHIVIVSDHGFARFDYKVHLNRWLVNHGYLTTGREGAGQSLRDADWPRSRAYAAGLNSLYLNIAGRESQGCLPADRRDALTAQLSEQLLAWKGPDGKPVVQQVFSQREAFDGPLAAYGPDLVVGFARGYRASQETGLGKWGDAELEPNRDHWGADHCMAPEAVPGVLFSSQGLNGFAHPSYRDIPELALGMALDPKDSAPPPTSGGGEDEQVLEERLKSLGYL